MEYYEKLLTKAVGISESLSAGNSKVHSSNLGFVSQLSTTSMGWKSVSFPQQIRPKFDLLAYAPLKFAQTALCQSAVSELSPAASSSSTASSPDAKLI